jgi:hypothetical protein
MRATMGSCGGYQATDIPTATSGRCGCSPAATDTDEGPERRTGRGVSPVVSEIQASMTNGGTSARGSVTPDLLTLSALGTSPYFYIPLLNVYG